MVGMDFVFNRFDQSLPNLNGPYQDDTIIINGGTFFGGDGGVVVNSADD